MKFSIEGALKKALITSASKTRPHPTSSRYTYSVPARCQPLHLTHLANTDALVAVEVNGIVGKLNDDKVIFYFVC